MCVVNRHACTAFYWFKYFKNFQTRPRARTRTTFNEGRCTGHFTFHEDLLEEVISHLQTDLKIAGFVCSSFRVRWRIKIWSKWKWWQWGSMGKKKLRFVSRAPSTRETCSFCNIETAGWLRTLGNSVRAAVAKRRKRISVFARTLVTRGERHEWKIRLMGARKFVPPETVRLTWKMFK